MKKIILLVILVIILVFAGGIIIYAKDAPVFDVFYSQENRAARVLSRMCPEKLGDFSLYMKPEKAPDISGCKEINETIDGENFNGNLCTTSSRAEYRNSNNTSIFINISKITSGKKVLKQIWGKVFKTDKLYGYDVTRVENHEIMWLLDDKADFDWFDLQEALVRKNTDGSETMLPQDRQIGNNFVAEYFITKYPPVQN